jgi:two-component system, chemotaxis family, CheB/CheR fusion protein
VFTARKPRVNPAIRGRPPARRTGATSGEFLLDAIRDLQSRVNELEIGNRELNNLLASNEALVETTKAAAAALEQRVEERTKQLRRLAFELARAEESERQAIARDLHDDLGQVLAVARLKLAKLTGAETRERERLAEELAELLGRAESRTRSLAFQLSPAVLYELGLIPALEWLTEEVKKTYGLAVEFSDDAAAKPLSQAARAILFRAIRELLINVVKHSGVSTARLAARRVDNTLEVIVKDDGNGFEPARISAGPRGGFGLTSVRERLSFIGGSVDVSSVPGDGTEVTLRAPLQTH